MPVLFQFPRSTRSSKARPLHSAMRKSGARSIRRRMKTVHFASTKTLLSAPRTPPTLPLIPYDALGHARSSSSTYPRGPHTPNTPNFSHGSGTTAASSAGPHTPSTTQQHHAQNLSPDLIAYYQPSSSTLKPLPPGVPAKVVHAEMVPLDVEWDEAWEWEGGREPPLDPARVESSSSSSMGRRMGRVVRRGREKIPREMLPKTPHPRKAIDMHMPGLSPSIGLASGGEGSYFPAGYGYTASEGGHGAEEHRGRERSRRREMLDRLTGRSRSRSQQPQEYPPAPPPPQPHAYAQTQQHHTSGSGLLQVPQRARRGSFSSTTSGPQQIQLSSSAPAPSASYKWSNTSTDGRGHGQLQINYAYPPPPPLAVASSPSAQSHHPHTHTRSRTPSFSTIPRPNTPLSYSHPQSAPHQQTHYQHQSASAYPAPPPNVRRRSHSNPPEARYAYPPPSPTAPHHVQHHASANGAVYTPQVQSASQFLNIPSRERDGGRKRAGSFSYGAPPPPSPHPSVSAHRDARPVVVANGNAAYSSSKPQMLRRRTASNPHLSSGGHHSHQHQPSSARHRAAPTPHRYLTIPSSSHSHSSDPHISWDVRLPPSTATRTRVARGASSAKVYYLSPEALVEPATSPSCASMRVSATRAVQSGRREGWPWPIAIHPQGSSVTLNDVLYSIHTALRARASETEYERLLPDKMDKRAVSAAYEERWRGETKAGGEKRKNEVGLRRVDFLRGRTAFVGLEPVGGGEGEWCLVVK
ncbi:hypothetical protein D9619_007641 [Psilocybe cf. subviscida]|uniref:DUF6699 domain-containing protein n=1 Tax=Psilocybe cf. subviscida TaxID=2480587 RepID=A0A8H5ATR8_9AGAR|nr:hypothetical protein D9619_007641 [Psilocybe cf. subviscida]